MWHCFASVKNSPGAAQTDFLDQHQHQPGHLVARLDWASASMLGLFGLISLVMKRLKRLEEFMQISPHFPLVYLQKGSDGTKEEGRMSAIANKLRT